MVRKPALVSTLLFVAITSRCAVNKPSPEKYSEYLAEFSRNNTFVEPTLEFLTHR
jgi:hypothetical protein